MADAAPAESRYTSERYFALVDQGVLRPDDRVELLEGVVVAMSPQNSPHAAVMSQAARVLGRIVGERAAVRVQLPLIAGPYSVPEPDVAIVPGREIDYHRAHPTTAFLVVEVADSSLAQDRLTKAAIYAAAAIPEYWLVNLRDECVEVHRTPEPSGHQYAERHVARRGDRIELVSLAGVIVAVSDLLPPAESAPDAQR